MPFQGFLASYGTRVPYLNKDGRIFGFLKLDALPPSCPAGEYWPRLGANSLRIVRHKTFKSIRRSSASPFYFPRILRAATRICSRNQACEASLVRRECQLIKYGKGLISRGGSTFRKPARPAVIVAKLRGTVRTRSVSVMAKTAGIKNGILNATRRFSPSAASGWSTIA
jgi:hypothetical protein